eukprot:6280932-Pyramimonas_sp.AAC.1
MGFPDPRTDLRAWEIEVKRSPTAWKRNHPPGAGSYGASAAKGSPCCSCRARDLFCYPVGFRNSACRRQSFSQSPCCRSRGREGLDMCLVRGRFLQA